MKTLIIRIAFNKLKKLEFSTILLKFSASCISIFGVSQSPLQLVQQCQFSCQNLLFMVFYSINLYTSGHHKKIDDFSQSAQLGQFGLNGKKSRFCVIVMKLSTLLDSEQVITSSCCFLQIKIQDFVYHTAQLGRNFHFGSFKVKTFGALQMRFLILLESSVFYQLAIFKMRLGLIQNIDQCKNC